MDERIKIYNNLLTDEITGQKYRLWDGMKLYDDEWKYVDKIIKKRDKINYLYLTLSPDKFKRNIPINDLDTLKEWCSKWFCEKNNFYHGGVYVIEWGSNEEPHYHVHCLLNIKNSLKHAFKLKNYWKRYFPNSALETSLNLCCHKKGQRGEYCYAIITDREILQDKLDYFINDEKGFHENYVEIMKPFFFGESIKI